ncbi:RNA polymerase sigma factor [Petrocella sp. FN5]|uniref:RNA polymerase sigma factor n=1 Tax=Petrocella sp. FN5 TaxID=3032002 RepID=UPI0023D9D012|nr:RNA polymerase sigma factor [Petrocella sp. FN5]MDF1617915.1 RNA polymerase sigma factor [Petrocella sp. FN5]
MIAFLMTIENEKTRNKLEEIYVTYYKEIYVTAYSILKDHHDAQDVIQDAILRILKNIHKISEVKCKKTRSYLVIIVRNLCYNVYNKRKGIVMLEYDEVKRLSNQDEILIEEEFLQIEFSEKIAKYLEQLHQPYADVLTLRYYYELEISEIARNFNITENNVSVRIYRALEALKKILVEEGVDYEQSV